MKILNIKGKIYFHPQKQFSLVLATKIRLTKKLTFKTIKQKAIKKIRSGMVFNMVGENRNEIRANF